MKYNMYIAFLFIFFSTAINAIQLSKDATPDRLFEQSKFIVWGTCISKKVVEVHGVPLTHVTYEISKSFKGNLEKNEKIIVGILGGNGARFSAKLPKAPQPQIGERAILLLKRKNNNGLYILSGFHKGHIPLQLDSNGVEYVIPKHQLLKLPSPIIEQVQENLNMDIFNNRIKAFLLEEK